MIRAPQNRVSRQRAGNPHEASGDTAVMSNTPPPLGIATPEIEATRLAAFIASEIEIHGWARAISCCSCASALSVGALMPRGGLPLLTNFKYLFAKWDLDRTIESHGVFFTRSHRGQLRLGTDLLPELMSEWIGAALRRSGPARDDQTAPNQSLL